MSWPNMIQSVQSNGSKGAISSKSNHQPSTKEFRGRAEIAGAKTIHWVMQQENLPAVHLQFCNKKERMSSLSAFIWLSFFWSRFRLCESGHPACASELVLGLQNRLHPRLPETSVQQLCGRCVWIGREYGNNTSCVMHTNEQYLKRRQSYAPHAELSCHSLIEHGHKDCWEADQGYH